MDQIYRKKIGAFLYEFIHISSSSRPAKKPDAFSKAIILLC